MGYFTVYNSKALHLVFIFEALQLVTNLTYCDMFQEYLHIAPVHVQLEATNSFSSIIQNGTIPAYMFGSYFLPIILHNINNRDSGKSYLLLSVLIISFTCSVLQSFIIIIIVIIIIISIALYSSRYIGFPCVPFSSYCYYSVQIPLSCPFSFCAFKAVGGR